MKDIVGIVNFKSKLPEVEKLRKYRAPIPSLSKTLKYLHDQHIYVIARMALFQDQMLATQRPDLAIKNGKGILLWKGKPLWVDPARREVQSYNLLLVRELIQSGVDEIQFDYVRYPAEGDLSQARYYNVKKPADKTFHLKKFLAGAWILTRDTGVKISIDIFGVVAWGENLDIAATGQRIEELAPFVDIISPMLYPSHFNKGFDNIPVPADAGHYFYYQGVKKILEKTGDRVVVRPWLQAFPWRVTNYNEHYIKEQIRGIREAGGLGWMMWNAGNKYDMPYRALADLPPRKKRPRANSRQ